MNKNNVHLNAVLPKHETGLQHTPQFVYETDDQISFIHYLEYGSPNPLIGWHFHDEFELHLITRSSGKVFVGDYIGEFEAGHLSLIGSRLPHNWITYEQPEVVIPLRDKCLQFRGEALYQALGLIPDLRIALDLLERSKNGIEFFGISAEVEALMDALKESSGLHRLSLFIQVLEKLAGHDDYRILSSAYLQLERDDRDMNRIREIVNFISENYASQFNMAELAPQYGMTPSRFSRFFKQRTGNTFTDYVNRLRMNKACQLLIETDQYISTVCYNVGFNNVANFNRHFKEIRGMTPTDYRRMGKLNSRLTS